MLHTNDASGRAKLPILLIKHAVVVERWKLKAKVLVFLRSLFSYAKRTPQNKCERNATFFNVSC